MYPDTISSPYSGVGENNARDGGRRKYDEKRAKAGEEGERGGGGVDPTSSIDTTMATSAN